MLEFFADSLFNGYCQSSAMGKGIVLLQLAGSVVMFTFIFGKLREFAGLEKASRRVVRDVMGSRQLLDHYLTRQDNGHTPLENIYWCMCDRLVRQLPLEIRNRVLGRDASVAVTLTEEQIDLVKSIGDHMLDEEAMRVEWGMGAIATVVALAPMLGLLGTVWGVLDAFADMGAAGSATIATMAPAISSALVTTVVGLLVAIPGIACHNHLSAKMRKLMSDMEGFLDDLSGRIARDFQRSGGEA